MPKKERANVELSSVRQQQIERITAANDRLLKIRRGFKEYNIKGTGIKDDDIRNLMHQFPENVDIWLQLRVNETQKESGEAEQPPSNSQTASPCP